MKNSLSGIFTKTERYKTVVRERNTGRGENMPLARRLRYVLLVVVVILAICLSASAQTETATLSGVVQDPRGAVVPDVEVTATRIETGTVATTKSNGAGVYVFTDLMPGHYHLLISKPGFKEIAIKELELHVQDKLEQNFSLEIGSVSETVTVRSEGLVMNTTDGSISTVIDRHFVENIPLNGRSFQDLISLTPGVVTQNPQNGGSTGSNGDFSINGQRPESNSYIVDGVSANTAAGGGNGTTGPGTSGSLAATTALGTTQSLLSVDALQEFRVESSTYSAEYGRAPGGQFSIVSRSGTSAFHGSLFDYLRNDAFDANDWFNDYYDVAKPALRQNDFGGTVGGPVWIPGHSELRQNTFFFLSYEGLRLDQPTEASLQYVPSNSLRAAAPNALQPILNAFPLPTGAEIQIACDGIVYPCNGQPVGTLVPSGLAPFVKAYSLPSRIDSTSLRLDHAIGARTHAFLRAAYTPSSSDFRLLSALYETKANQQTYTGGIDTQISNTVANEVRIGYSRSTAESIASLDNFGGAVPVNLAQSVGTAGYSRPATYFTLILNGVGTSSIETASPANYQRQWNVTDGVSWAVGHNSVKVGIDYRRITSPFTYAGDPLVDPVYETLPSVLNNVADLTVIERARPAEPVYNQFALYGQDQWRVTPALNISLGLRWEVDPAPASTNANKPYPLLGNPNDPSTYSLGVPGASLYKTTWKNFAPRIGAAWKFRGNTGTETVLRAGVGIFYDTGSSATASQFEAGLGNLTSAFPSGLALPLTPAQLNLPFTVTPPYSTVYAVASNLQLPYTVQWTAAFEQELGQTQNLTVSYVAAEGERLVKYNAINAGQFNPNFTTVLLEENGLTSNYQSLQVQFQRRVSRGLQALASYVWAHNIDYGSQDNDYGYKRGNSDFDLRNNFNAALSWDLPLNMGNTLAKAALNGWGLDARVTARSGFPVPLQGATFFDPITGAQQYAGLDLVPGVPVYIYSSHLPGGRQINSNAFANAPAGTLGNAPRNFVRGFGEEQLNLAVRREFPLGEKLRLQFRAEAFNILNHPNFGYIDPNLGDATFGQATNTLAQSLGTVSPIYQQGGARSIQFALKLLF
jgi:hypothetical protein